MVVNTFSEVNNFNQYIKNLPVWNDGVTRNAKKVMEDDECFRVPLRESTAGNDGYDILYVKVVTEVLRKKVELYEKEDIMFHPDHGITFSRAASPSMTTKAHNKMLPNSKKADDGIS